MPTKAPVSDVGGNQAAGPWPDGVEEIVAGEQYKRPVRLNDGSTRELTVTVVEIVDLDEDGYAVSYTHDDPTLDGGGA